MFKSKVRHTHAQTVRREKGVGGGGWREREKEGVGGGGGLKHAILHTLHRLPSSSP